MQLQPGADDGERLLRTSVRQDPSRSAVVAGSGVLHDGDGSRRQQPDALVPGQQGLRVDSALGGGVDRLTGLRHGALEEPGQGHHRDDGAVRRPGAPGPGGPPSSTMSGGRWPRVAISRYIRSTPRPCLLHEVERSEQVGQGPGGRHTGRSGRCGRSLRRRRPPRLAGALSSLLEIAVLLIHNFDATGKVSWGFGGRRTGGASPRRSTSPCSAAAEEQPVHHRRLDPLPSR